MPCIWCWWVVFAFCEGGFTGPFMTHMLRHCFSALALSFAACAVGQLPPDHPPIGVSENSGMSGEVPAFLKQLEDGPKGMLAVRAIQGTKDGQGFAGDEVEVTLFHRDVAVKQMRSVLDDQGVALIGDIPVGIGVSPLVRIRHSGVQYQDSAPDMSPENTSAKVDITVYEVTDEMPAWKYVMRHMVVEQRSGQYVASEVVVVENLGDKTWLGEPADMLKRRATVPLPLPAGASDVELVQGFHGWCCSAMKGSTLQVQMPFMPGKMTYKFAYRVTPKDGVLDLRVAMPREAGSAAFFVPDDGTKLEPALVTEAGADTSGAQRLKMFEAKAVPANQVVGLVVRMPDKAVVVSAERTEKTGVPVWVLAGGGVAAAVGAFVAWKMLAGKGK